MFSKIAVASDHAGVSLKEDILSHLEKNDYVSIDLGPPTDRVESVDYPNYAAKVATMLVEKKADAGIAICGTGIGMSIAANKFLGIRAACPWDKYSCEMARKHNNINVLCLGARTLTPENALAILETWLTTPFEGDRHEKRLKIISGFEDN